MKSIQKTYHLIYPHQLFKEVYAFKKDVTCVLIEDPLFFKDKEHPRRFHKQKLVLHRASMKAFADQLQEKGFSVVYMACEKYPDPAFVAHFLKKHHATTVTVYDPVDHILEKRLRDNFLGFSEFTLLETPNFLTSLTAISTFFKGKKKYLMNSFYIYQRKRLGLLLDSDGKPLGGKWSFDAENRKRLPQDISIPPVLPVKKDAYLKEALSYVQRLFKDNPGDVEDFIYPFTHAQAEAAFKDFIQKRLYNFGAYEDAISQREVVLFHSVLSPALNIGLLSPKDVIDQVVAVQHKVPLASIEGFIRQVVGWREFMRAVYVLRGSSIRSKNSLGHTGKLSSAWYNGSTGIEPVDVTIKKVVRYAYCHHIERLMILGNIMLLAQIDPTAVYGWFMDMFIDAYDWVMVPNVYAMSQFADGGTITTKPYFSSSNYVLKMSDYKKGYWCTVWDGLFYNFLATHRSLIEKNPRLKVLIKNLDNLSEERWQELQDACKKYL